MMPRSVTGRGMTVSSDMRRTKPEVGGTRLEDQDFLTRWSRRKQALRQGEELPDAPVPADRGAASAEATQSQEAEQVRIDPRTGKPYDELTDDDMPDPDSLSADSDVSMFMAKNISPALRMKALTRIFRTAKFNKVCLCAEYAEDYTSFTPLGDIVPHDLKAAIVREAEKLRAHLKERGLEISDEDARARIAAESRGEKLPDVESLARRTRDHEVEQAQAERPDRLQS